MFLGVSVADVIGTPSVCKARVFRTPGQIISLMSDFSFVSNQSFHKINAFIIRFQSSNEFDADPFHPSISAENPYVNDHSHRSQTSSRNIDCSFRPCRQNLPACIPENEPLSLGNDEFDHWKETNTSEYLFSSPKKRSSNVSQTIKQQPRIYPNTVSRLLASSPAHQNQYRVYRGKGQAGSSTTTLTAISSSVSPCLSPIRYAFDRSQISDSHSNEGVIQMDDGQMNQVSLPADDSSLKVSMIV